MDKYKKELEYSYTFGIFPTFELINNKPDSVIKIMIHEKLKITKDTTKLVTLCKLKNIEIEYCTKQIEKIVDKENTMIVGVFKKYTSNLQKNSNNVVLVNPSDMGNLGTIIRTCLGFNIKNIAIITPCADIFNPKTIRASMGAIFSVNIKLFNSFSEYTNEIPNNNYYPFMLQATKTLQSLKKEDKKTPFSLIFGNEGSGLDKSFLNIGQSIIIEHSKNIDSLNLPISVSIALYEFCK